MYKVESGEIKLRRLLLLLLLLVRLLDVLEHLLPLLSLLVDPVGEGDLLEGRQVLVVRLSFILNTINLT